MDKFKHKREQELKTVTDMISIYCRDVHKTDGGTLCPECEELLDYVEKRVNNCPRIGEQTLCSECSTHCFAPNRRQKMQEIMRYSGPKMMLRSPVMALRHKLIQWFNTIQNKACNIF